MRIGIIIVCRYDSIRLQGKILYKIEGKPVLSYILERIKKVSNVCKLVVATSDEKNDEPIADFCRRNGIVCFRGYKDDVAGRMLMCAQKYKFDYFIRICGDNIFTDYDLINRMIDITLKTKADLVSNIKNRTFPHGTSVEIINTDFFAKEYRKFSSFADKEHVTRYLYEHEQETNRFEFVFNDNCPEARNLYLALDDQKDLAFITSIVRKMKRPQQEYLLKDIWELSLNI